MIRVAKLSPKLAKELRKNKPPTHIVAKLLLWVRLVETKGLEEARKTPSWHDEPLQGERKGERSIRLNKAYRAFYAIKEDGEIEIAWVFEVNKHDY